MLHCSPLVQQRVDFPIVTLLVDGCERLLGGYPPSQSAEAGSRCQPMAGESPPSRALLVRAVLVPGWVKLERYEWRAQHSETGTQASADTWTRTGDRAVAVGRYTGVGEVPHLKRIQSPMRTV